MVCKKTGLAHAVHRHNREVGFLDYRESMQRVVDYIEENLSLCDMLTTERLADVAGYSKYHFVRIFVETTGFIPADYIRKRRLSEIAGRLDGHTGSIAELAFAYGFNSKENFVRAFKAEHRVLPTEYRKMQNSLRLYPKFRFEKWGDVPDERFLPEPVFCELAPFSLTVFESDEAFPPHFWNQYNCKGLSARLSGGRAVPDYGVSDWDAKENRLRYYIGIRTADACGDTAGTKQLSVSGGTYAVFATKPAGHFDFVDTIQATWEYINTRWLAKSGYVRTGGYEFETYVEASRMYSEEIYIPVRRQEGGCRKQVSQGLQDLRGRECRAGKENAVFAAERRKDEKIKHYMGRD